MARTLWQRQRNWIALNERNFVVVVVVVVVIVVVVAHRDGFVWGISLLPLCIKVQVLHSDQL